MGIRNNAFMTDDLRAVFELELQAGLTAAEAWDHERAFQHLARAHILGQRSTFRHAYVHWLMLKLGLELRDWREVGGQIARIVSALLFSRIWVPAGNSGLANVSALKPMPVPEDLRVLLEGNGK